MKISLNYLISKLKDGTATAEEQKQAAPIFYQMVMLGQAAMGFSQTVQGIMDADPAPPAPRPTILVPG